MSSLGKRSLEQHDLKKKESKTKKQKKSFIMSDAIETLSESEKTTFNSYENIDYALEFMEHISVQTSELENIADTLTIQEFCIRNIDLLLEKKVIFRCLPGYKREVGYTSAFTIGTLTNNQWCKYISRKLNIVPAAYDDVNTRATLPTQAGKMYVDKEKVVFSNGKLPPLCHNERWWFKRWFTYVDNTIYYYRMFITDFTFIYDFFNEKLSVQFTYIMQHINTQAAFYSKKIEWCYSD